MNRLLIKAQDYENEVKESYIFVQSKSMISWRRFCKKAANRVERRGERDTIAQQLLEDELEREAIRQEQAKMDAMYAETEEMFLDDPYPFDDYVESEAMYEYEDFDKYDDHTTHLDYEDF